MKGLSMFCMLLTICCAQTLAAMSYADDIIRIEEDWTVLVQNPAPEIQAPQITNIMSPCASTAGQYGVFEFNHGTQSEFITGGAQVQVWDDDTPLDYHNSIEGRLLTRNYDRLKYTLVMEIHDGKLCYKIVNGSSRTWGNFTWYDDIRASVDTPFSNLNAYDRDHSLEASSVNVAAHRVYMIYQREVRYYDADGLDHTDTQDKTIHRYSQLVQDVSLEEYAENPEYYNVEPTTNE